MIDQEIRDALRVEPSPEFLARVRTRIASEPAPSRWRSSWTFAAAGALAAGLLIAAVISRPSRQTAPPTDVVQAFPPPRAVDGGALRRGSPKLPGSEGGRPAVTSPSPANEQPLEVVQAFPPPRGGRPAIAGLNPRGGSRNASDAAVRVKPDTTELPLLFDHSEMRALQALIAGVRDGRVDLAAAQTNAAPAPIEQEPVTDIVIAPITIDPIAPLSGAEGVRP